MRSPTLGFLGWLSLAVIGCGDRMTPHAEGGDRDAGADEGDDDDRPGGDVCHVRDVDDLDGVPDCDNRAPPGSFDPEIQWTWTGTNAPYSSVTPLVANLTDDNGDGSIDLCDTPDVVVVATAGRGAPGSAGYIYLLDGATGAELRRFQTAVDATHTPALGDLDGDAVPEIVTATTDGRLIGFEHDGAVAWTGDVWRGDRYAGSIALADLDADGDVEIVAGESVYDDRGKLLWSAPLRASYWPASVAADLDGDGDLEVVLGSAAYHHDGSVYYEAAIGLGFPQIANLDDDPDPEVLVTTASGVALLEHDGTIVYRDLRPTDDPVGPTTWVRPATVHDFDGDGAAEYALSSANHYTVYEGDGSIVWSATVSDASGVAGGTAFDFLGDGIAEAMYADEYQMFAFDRRGDTVFRMPRTSPTVTEYPVVADIDNDGSAEIVVVSAPRAPSSDPTSSPTVQVIRDREDRWIQARRIWNQHTYHVTNVREDGTIPQHERRHWLELNTFRTNAQIGDDGVCEPLVE